jgi:hypothetical protein
LNVFEIDLKQGTTALGTVPTSGADVRRVAVSFLPVVAAVAFLSTALWTYDRSLDRSIEREEASLSTLEASLTASRQQLAELSGKHRVAYGVAPQEVYWSDELRLISEKLPDKAWITAMRINSATPPAKPAQGEAPAPLPQNLTIEGAVLSNSSEGNLDVIGKFVESLQADRRFKETFSAINLESVQRMPDPFALAFRLRLDLKS